jgi:hypothetical protein
VLVARSMSRGAGWLLAWRQPSRYGDVVRCLALVPTKGTQFRSLRAVAWLWAVLFVAGPSESTGKARPWRRCDARLRARDRCR